MFRLLVRSIWMEHSGFSGISNNLPDRDFTSRITIHCNSLPTVTRIGEGVKAPDGLPQGTISVLVELLYHGARRSNEFWHALLQRPNTVSWRVLLVKFSGCAGYCRSSTFHKMVRPRYTVITRRYYILPTIPFSTNGLSMWKWIVISFENEFSLDTFCQSKCTLIFSLLTYSLRVLVQPAFVSSFPSCTFVISTLQLAGEYWAENELPTQQPNMQRQPMQGTYTPSPW
ncbi:unnamed protein product [Linum tenue]|uniref:Uncharacterized protein n=1 Tax=Linum tenue TaxID=586396 RepID=A0AAV0IPG7_9ROSI|nr:unnamed protein product [Linum tenue]